MSAELLKRRLKRTILDAVARCGYVVHKDPTSFPPYRLLKRLELGEDALADVRTIRGSAIESVFDVGAHVGQTAARLADVFPRAHIYSFEPDPQPFSELRRLASACARIRPINAAVGDKDGETTFFVNKFNQTSSLLKTADGAEQYLVDPDGMTLQQETRIAMVTVDGFCAEHGIDHIDLLKLDTQGSELRVLDGARHLLARRAIPVIYLEVSFVRYYENQPLFPEVYQYLYDRGYRLVWLYERGFHTHFYSVGANGLFVHESVGDRAGQRDVRQFGFARSA